MDNIAELLEGTLDDLADLKGFKVPPTGAYGVVVVDIGSKTINNKPAVEANFKILEVLEVSEGLELEESPPAAGDEFSTLFILDNETGQGFYKEFLKAFAGHFKTAKISELMALIRGSQVVITVKRTKNEKTDRYNLNIKKVIMA